MPLKTLLDDKYKRQILLAVSIIASLILFSSGRIPQDSAYHLFADTEKLAGLPNFWNVVSNLPFLLVGIFGLWRAPRIAVRACQPAYLVLCIGITWVAFGSAYYHYAPSNESLLWDRLPMTAAFMALFAMILEERVIMTRNRWLLWLLVGCGIASAMYWSWTEKIGQGDLRPYAAVQFLPMMLMPLIMFLFANRYLSNTLLISAFVWYAMAKGLEHYDQPIHLVFGVIGGHPLKHIAAAIAALCIVLAVPVKGPAR